MCPHKDSCDINKCLWHTVGTYKFIKIHSSEKDKHNSIQVPLIETLSPGSLINLYFQRDLNWPIQPQGIQVALRLPQTDMSLESRCDRGPNISHSAMSDYQVALLLRRIWNYLSSVVNKPAAPPQLSADALKNLAALLDGLWRILPTATTNPPQPLPPPLHPALLSACFALAVWDDSRSRSNWKNPKAKKKYKIKCRAHFSNWIFILWNFISFSWTAFFFCSLIHYFLSLLLHGNGIKTTGAVWQSLV